MDENIQRNSLQIRVLLGVSGSVASIKTVSLVKALIRFAEVRIVSTQSAMHFFRKNEIPLEVPLFTDSDEWNSWQRLNDPVLHVELRKWADIFLIAPLSANSLAKLANGFCDNLLTCIARAWDFQRPLVVAPAMNTMMWEHPFTEKHLAQLAALGVHVISPTTKKLACGDTGMGAMAEVDTIVHIIENFPRKTMPSSEQCFPILHPRLITYLEFHLKSDTFFHNYYTKELPLECVHPQSSCAKFAEILRFQTHH